MIRESLSLSRPETRSRTARYTECNSRLLGALGQPCILYPVSPLSLSFLLLPPSSCSQLTHPLPRTSRRATIRSLVTRIGWDTVIWIAHSLTSAVVLARVFLAPSSPSDDDDNSTMATATNQPVLGEDGKPLSPKSSTTYNEDVVSFTDPATGTQKRAVVTVSPHTLPHLWQPAL